MKIKGKGNSIQSKGQDHGNGKGGRGWKGKGSRTNKLVGLTKTQVVVEQQSDVHYKGKHEGAKGEHDSNVVGDEAKQEYKEQSACLLTLVVKNR